MYAVMASLVFYIIIVEVISRATPEPDIQPQIDIIRYVIYAVAISMIFATQLVKAVMLRNASRMTAEMALARLQTSNIIVAGLAETPAILGFVMYLAWRQYTDFYILALVSLYVCVRHFPRRANWERVVESATRGE